MSRQKTTSSNRRTHQSRDKKYTCVQCGNSVTLMDQPALHSHNYYGYLCSKKCVEESLPADMPLGFNRFLVKISDSAQGYMFAVANDAAECGMLQLKGGVISLEVYERIIGEQAWFDAGEKYDTLRKIEIFLKPSEGKLTEKYVLLAIHPSEDIDTALLVAQLLH